MTMPASREKKVTAGDVTLADEMRDLAKRAHHHFKNKTTDQAESVMQLPVGAYLDEGRFQREFARIFTQLPLGLALSIELPEAGSYLARTVCRKPVLLTRDTQGKTRAFLNVCRHRGATVCPDGAGKKSRFTCPYHSWAYAADGTLTRVNAEKTFGEVDKSALGLTPLPCAEKSGVIWVALDPQATFDIGEWLGDFSKKLDSLDLRNWYLYEQRDLPGPGWKATLDGYLEVYHHDSVHGKTVGKHTVGNLLVHDTYGPHQRLTFGRKTLGDLAGNESGDWDGSQYIRIVHSVFPNLSISGIVGGHCLVSQVVPGDGVVGGHRVRSVLAPDHPVDVVMRGRREGRNPAGGGQQDQGGQGRRRAADQGVLRHDKALRNHGSVPAVRVGDEM
mgnify:CR=1 FL=1